MITRYLYRGVNADLYARTGGRLEPKAIGREFKRPVYFGEDVYFGGGSTFGESADNAALMHQENSSRYPSSGVSTTPHIEKARGYATHNNQAGYIYKIDSARLQAAGITAYLVKEVAVHPAVPDDEEVILVARDYGALPAEVVVEVVRA
ncbi:MAG: hypothetical protein JWN13_106 [Betaproteobacteria bacterium]|nr:hypothetical protein [Betaproteobacteria bacterium]